MVPQPPVNTLSLALESLKKLEEHIGLDKDLFVSERGGWDASQNFQIYPPKECCSDQGRMPFDQSESGFFNQKLD